MFFIVFLIIFLVLAPSVVVSGETDMDNPKGNLSNPKKNNNDSKDDYYYDANAEPILHGLIPSQQFKTIIKNFTSKDVLSALKENYNEKIYDATNRVLSALCLDNKETKSLIFNDEKNKVNMLNLILFDKYVTKAIEASNIRWKGHDTRTIEPISILQTVALVTQNLIKEENYYLIKGELSKLKQSQIPIILENHQECEDYITKAIDILFDINKKNNEGRSLYSPLADLYGNTLRKKLGYGKGNEFITIKHGEDKFFGKNLADQEANYFPLTVSHEKYYNEYFKDEKEISKSRYNKILLKNNEIDWALLLYLGCKKTRDTNSDMRFLLLTPILQLLETHEKLVNYKLKKHVVGG
jgi:hypothetical protein